MSEQQVGSVAHALRQEVSVEADYLGLLRGSGTSWPLA